MCQGFQSELRWHSLTRAFPSPWMLHVIHALRPAPAVPSHPRGRRGALGPRSAGPMERWAHRFSLDRTGRAWLCSELHILHVPPCPGTATTLSFKIIIINLVFKIKKEIAAFLSRTHFLWCFPGLIETRQAAGVEEAGLPCVGRSSAWRMVVLFKGGKRWWGRGFPRQTQKKKNPEGAPVKV